MGFPAVFSFRFSAFLLKVSTVLSLNYCFKKKRCALLIRIEE